MPNILDQGYLALPSTPGRVPTVLLIPAWWGLNTFFKQCCDRLAESGYLVFAPDLYRGKVAETIAEAEAFSSALDTEVTIAWMHDTVEALRHHERSNGQSIGVIGFSLGAFLGLSLLQTRPEQMRTLVLFYGTGGDSYVKTSATVLAHFAETDPFEPPESQAILREALQKAGISATFYTYPGTGHWFFEPNRPDAYNAEAADLAWERTLAFLKETLSDGH